ncbi:hypothetical protein JTB14_029664 [Gonioctena quinquepunctata]|nr:hypothetical protein JTB14_029664 [Gonioctena quinquepunctata]
MENKRALLEELEETEASLNKYQNDMAELDVINKNMITSIRTLLEENEHHEEPKKIKYDSFILRNRQKSMNSQKTTIAKESITPTNNPGKDAELNNTSGKTSSPRSKILFLSGSHGKSLTVKLMDHMRQYDCQSLRKPGANSYQKCT